MNNPIPRELYHTDWLADLAASQLDTDTDGEDWFIWLSFPDPHHPWDPPASELGRVRWQDLDLPPGHPGSDEAIARVLADKPAHWLAYWEGRFNNREGGGARLDVQTLTHDMIREINAKTHVMNELIDEAVGRVLAHLETKSWANDTDVFFTTDHGDLAGDYGLMYKDPYHTDSLMRLPLIWRPAPSAGVCRSRTGSKGRPCPAPTTNPGVSGCCLSGTASSRVSACTCAPSTETAGSAPPTSHRRAASPPASRRAR
jgi:arylsulfatase A-like enzyme